MKVRDLLVKLKLKLTRVITGTDIYIVLLPRRYPSQQELVCDYSIAVLDIIVVTLIYDFY